MEDKLKKSKKSTVTKTFLIETSLLERANRVIGAEKIQGRNCNFSKLINHSLEEFVKTYEKENKEIFKGQ